MKTYMMDSITVDILLDKYGYSGNSEISRQHLIEIEGILMTNESAMTLGKLTRIIDLQNGIASHPLKIHSSAAEKILHDLRDLQWLKLIKERRKSQGEIREMIELFIPKIYEEDEDGNEIEVSQVRYFNLIK